MQRASMHPTQTLNRRDLVAWASGSLAVAAVPAMAAQSSDPARSAMTSATTGTVFNVRSFGAIGDGETLDSPAINRAIEAAASAGGGTVYFSAGVYASYSIRLKSNIVLHLEQGATILGANTSLTGTTSG